MKSATFQILGLILILLISTSCEVTEDISNGSIEPPKHHQIKEISQGNLMGNGEEDLGSAVGLSIENAEQWEDLRVKMNSVNNTQNEVSIDFEETTVLAYFDKIRPSGGYKVEIVQVITSDEILKVMYKLNSSSGYDIEVMTQPFHIVSIPKIHRTVRFIQITE
jgi:hypothetical protein